MKRQTPFGLGNIYIFSIIHAVWPLTLQKPQAHGNKSAECGHLAGVTSVAGEGGSNVHTPAGSGGLVCWENGVALSC